MKVASTFSVKGKEQKELNMWIETLPIRLREGQKELIWVWSRNKTTIVWRDKGGFTFF